MANHQPHPAEHQTMDHFHSDINLQNDDELDRQIAEAAAGQSAYNEWKAQLAQDCHAAGVSFPTGHALLRAWNSEQRKRGEIRKQQTRVDKRIASILEQIATLQQELQQLRKQQGQPAKHQTTHLQNNLIEDNGEQDNELPDFDSMEQELLRIQEQRRIAQETASREQNEIFGNSPAEHQTSHLPQHIQQYDDNTDI